MNRGPIHLGYESANDSGRPVELPNALAGIRCGVTRQPRNGPACRPEEAFSARQAPDSFTRAGALASCEEDVRGRIAPGIYADFAVPSDSPFDAEPHSIKDIRGLQTVPGGETAYRA